MSLISIQIPKSLSHLGQRLFCECLGLEVVAIELNSCLRALPAALFDGCRSLNVTYITSALASLFLSHFEVIRPLMPVAYESVSEVERSLQWRFRRNSSITERTWQLVVSDAFVDSMQEGIEMLFGSQLRSPAEMIRSASVFSNDCVVRKYRFFLRT
jgi:hypothetical protein